ncbi:MAG: hypothetical protein F4W90_08505 [Gammaproteobacteria bacterium]|nr:hypothetical protein [Gammaproteobacteria bacterium]
MIRPLTFITLVIGILTSVSIGTRFYLFGDVTLVYAVLGVFLSINLLICYWEICLFLQRSYVTSRSEYWHQWHLATGKTPHAAFFLERIPWSKVLSPTTWADVWATYAQYDPAFADRRTFSFNVDVGNGFVTPLPTLALYIAIATESIAPLLIGVIGLMVFWQWTYMTSIYFVSFFVAGRHINLSRRDLWLYVVGFNAPWVLIPLLGLYVSFRLVADGSYSVLS